MSLRSPELSRLRFSALAAAALALVAGEAPAAAQTREGAAQASTLFEEGRRALAAKDEARACAAFRESLALDVKVGTLVNVAQCEEHGGELARAHAHLRQAIDRARAENDKRIAYLETQLAAIDQRVPKLTIQRSPQAPSGTVVRRDGILLGEVALGLAVPVDVGHHVIEASLGEAVKRYEVDLALGQRLTVEVAPPATSPPPIAAATPPSPSMSTSAPAVAPAPTSAASTWSSRTSTAVVLAAAGGVGLVVGAVFGFTALADRSDARSLANCDSSGACTNGSALKSWNDDHDAWSRAALVSTLGLAIGGAAATTGLVVWLTAPSADAHPAAASWNLALTPSTFALRARF